MCRMFSLRDPHFYPLALFALSILTHKVTHKHTNTLGIMHGVKHSSTNAKSKCVRVRRSWILPWNIWRYMELVGKIYRWRLKQIYCGLSFPLCSINMETLTKRNRHLERDGTTVHMFPGTCHTSWELYSDTRTWTDMPKKLRITSARCLYYGLDGIDQIDSHSRSSTRITYPQSSSHVSVCLVKCSLEIFLWINRLFSRVSSTTELKYCYHRATLQYYLSLSQLCLIPTRRELSCE